MILNKLTTRKNTLMRFDTLEKELLVIHNGKYDYSNTVFTNMTSKLAINCPLHGDFQQLPFNHLKGAGCPTCGKATTSRKNSLYSVAHLTVTAKKYNSRGEFQTKSPNEYMSAVNRGIYADICKHMPNEYNKRKTTAQFTKEVASFSDGEYAVVGKYTNRQTPIDIHHTVCGTTYSTTPATFIRGRKCPKCSISGFDQTKPAILYYLRITVGNSYIYKIGITNRTVQERYSLLERNSIEILREWHFKKGLNAYKAEQAIIEHYKVYKYIGEPVLHRGNTELFSINIKDYDDFTNTIQID